MSSLASSMDLGRGRFLNPVDPNLCSDPISHAHWP